jgi:hypothetical protein
MPLMQNSLRLPAPAMNWMQPAVIGADITNSQSIANVSCRVGENATDKSIRYLHPRPKVSLPATPSFNSRAFSCF